MQEKLRRSGVRSLGPLVDITNYVLLELGQPMHAFDLDKLRDGIGVRWSREGEELALLNGETAKLDGDTLLITDGDVPVAMAGIIGGDSTAVGDDTTNIFLESAFFAPVAIAGRARRYGLHTDASHRFERGVDPQQQRRAIERATQLLIEIAGGKAGPIVEALDQQQLPTSATVLLRRQRIELVLGIPMEDGEIVDILQRLGMDVVAVDGGWQVAAPSYRFDINIEEDLLEELARIHGYENLPNTRSHAEQAVRPRSERTNSAVRIANCLVDIDYQEAITYSFVDPKLQAMLDPDFEPIPLANPISSDMAVMRTSLWPGLVAAATYNLNRQQDRVRLFETGLRFRKAGDTTVQEAMIAGVCSGPIDVERWDGERHGVDFFDAKADVEVLLSLTGDASAFAFEVAEHPALHPGQSARIMKQGEVVGWLGALHPSHSSDLDVKQPIYLFELSLSSIQTRKMPVFSEISKFPAIRRDLALVVAEEISAQQLIDCMRSTETKWLRDLQLFDIYRGKGVASGKKSIALGLTLQNPSRTLTDTEVDKIIQDILQKLRDELEADLRN
jgi:phenylalanyl-tRNA synthetase beta chain